jgi:hypothetical protein
MSTLNKDEILGAIAERRKAVERISVPEWGGDVCIRRMTAADVERTGMADGKRDATMFAKVIAACVTDEDGEPLFTEKDVKALQEADMEASARVFAEIMRVNGLMDEELEEAVAGFAGAQPGSSSSS